VRAGLRAINLLRAFNIRHGYTTDRETLSPRYGSPVPDGPSQGKDIAPVFDKMLEIYYREMGWERTSGRPLPDALRKLNLEYVIPDLWPE